VGFPLFLGGRHPWGIALAFPTILVLLGITVRERHRLGIGARVPGLLPLAVFVAFASATTVPLPPALLRLLAPSAARLSAETLPGWPGGGGWTLWRTIALDPYAVSVELVRFSIGIGAFAVILAYPWDGEDGRRRVFHRLLLSLVVAGVLVA